jgi:hypothetical protein
MKVPSREHEIAHANIGQLLTHKVGHSYGRCKSSLNRTAIYLQGFEHRNWAQTVKSVNLDSWNRKTAERQNRRPMVGRGHNVRGDGIDLPGPIRVRLFFSSGSCLCRPSPRMIKSSTLPLACVLLLSSSWPSHAPSTAI